MGVGIAKLIKHRVKLGRGLGPDPGILHVQCGLQPRRQKDADRRGLLLNSSMRPAAWAAAISFRAASMARSAS
jgi:hypothetical protein